MTDQTSDQPLSDEEQKQYFEVATRLQNAFTEVYGERPVQVCLLWKVGDDPKVRVVNNCGPASAIHLMAGSICRMTEAPPVGEIHIQSGRTQ